MENIILTGGTTMIPGLSTRLYNELLEYYAEKKYGGSIKQTKKTGLSVTAPPGRMHSVFKGASLLAYRVPKCDWTSKQDLEEHGNSILHT